MAYRLDPAQPTAEEVRRIAVEQLDAAVVGLRKHNGPDAATVHDARKRLKKTRSLVRLARADFGKQVARKSNEDLRVAGRALSDRRDADVLVEVVDRLLEATDKADAVARSAVSTVRLDLAAHAAQAPLPTPDQLGEVVGRITDTSQRLVECRPRSHGWGAIGPGLADRYGRGREAMNALGDHPGDEALHDWRKRSKDVWYHLRLLEGVWPDVLAPVVAVASHLADLLGDDHDLAVLTAHLVPNEQVVRTTAEASTLAPVLAVVAAERARLQVEARALGHRLFADRPKAWSGRLSVWWTATAHHR